MSTVSVDPDRAARAALALSDGVEPWPGTEPGTFTVPSFTGGETYTVDLRERTCTCPDHRIRGVACKHQLACLLLGGVA